MKIEIVWGKIKKYLPKNEKKKLITSSINIFFCEEFSGIQTVVSYTCAPKIYRTVEMTAFIPTNLSSFHSIMPGVGVIVNTANKFVDCCDTFVTFRATLSFRF